MEIYKRTADVGDVQHADQAGVAGDWQWRKWPRLMSVAASGMLAVGLMTVGRAVIRSWIRVCSRSLPSATAWAMSFSVMMPIGWPVYTGRTVEGARARVLHKAGGCGRVVVLVCRREWWPHDVRDDGRGGWLSGLL